MKRAVLLSQRIINKINGFHEKYVTESGETVKSKDAINDLHLIIEDGLVLYKYLVDKKLYEKDAQIAILIIELEKFIEKLQINEKNSKKLTLSSAIQLWNQSKLVIANLACRILDLDEAENDTKEDAE